MAFLTLTEIVAILITTGVVGYIFLDMFKIQGLNLSSKEAFWYSVIATAPAVILHEFGHKIVALSFGFEAFFNAAYLWLGIGVLMKLFAGFIFIVPAYVSFSGVGITPVQSTIIAFAGPAVNGILYVGSILLLKYKKFSPRVELALIATKKLNGLLFIFNMLPIPPFDGFTVYEGLWQWLF